ncbi:MAG: hypothetical protein PHP42_02710 [Bacteroidota bacterium]|nr:hypothetical protein [Bacteroidota bacterium]
MKRYKYFTNILTIFILSGVVLFGCKKKDDPMTANSAATVSATEDAAESISGALGDDNGGTTNTMGTMFMLSSSAGISGTPSFGKLENVSTVDTSYDAGTGWWTATVSYQNNSSIYYSATFNRVYRFRFLKDVNNAGSFQKYYRIWNGASFDTASAINFRVDSGSGSFKTLRLSHQLNSVSGAWTATGINSDTVTINSDAGTSYIRKGIDTIVTRNAVRTSDHTLTLIFTNVKGPRFKISPTIARANLSQAYSGTVSGTFNASITFLRGDRYTEKNVSRTFTVTFGGGEGSITMDGKLFKCNMRTGERKDNP